MRKISNKLLFTILALTIVIVMIVVGIHWFNIERERDNEMPYVVVGGFPIYIEYTGESFVFAEELGDLGFSDMFREDLSIVQVGEIPILYKPDLVTAFNIYKNSEVSIKRIINGKLYESTVLIYNDEAYSPEDSYKYYSSTNAKVCFLLPNINRGISFAHPVNLERIYGVAYAAEFDELLDVDGSLNIYAKKSPVDISQTPIPKNIPSL